MLSICDTTFMRPTLEITQLSPGQCFVELIPGESDAAWVSGVEVTGLGGVVENAACGSG